MGCSSSITNTIYPPPNLIQRDKEIKENESFQKIKKIGKGAYAEVFLFKSKETQKEYALKAIKTKDVDEYIKSTMKEEVNNLKK